MNREVVIDTALIPTATSREWTDFTGNYPSMLTRAVKWAARLVGIHWLDQEHHFSSSFWQHGAKRPINSAKNRNKITYQKWCDWAAWPRAGYARYPARLELEAQAKIIVFFMENSKAPDRLYEVPQSASLRRACAQKRALYSRIGSSYRSGIPRTNSRRRLHTLNI